MNMLNFESIWNFALFSASIENIFFPVTLSLFRPWELSELLRLLISYFYKSPEFKVEGKNTDINKPDDDYRDITLNKYYFTLTLFGQLRDIWNFETMLAWKSKFLFCFIFARIIKTTFTRCFSSHHSWWHIRLWFCVRGLPVKPSKNQKIKRQSVSLILHLTIHTKDAS